MAWVRLNDQSRALARGLVCLALGLGVSQPAMGQVEEIPVPAQVQLPLLLKVLSYDRNLTQRFGEEIVIGVLFQERYRVSFEFEVELMREARSSSVRTVNELPFRLVPLNLNRIADLDAAVSEHEIDVLYVCPVRALDLGALIDLARTRKISTLAALPEYVEKGLAVGIGIRAERPLIFINLSASVAEGAGFSSRLLRLKVVEIVE